MLILAMAEDSHEDALRVRLLLDRFLNENAIEACLRTFENGQELVDGYSEDIDLVLLDIDMPVMDGLSAARAIRHLDSTVSICFMTNYSQLAPEGYSVDAMGFLIKPISYRSLQQVLRKAIERNTRRRTQLIPIKQAKQTVFVDANEICYVETERKKTVIHTIRGPIFCSEPMKTIEEKLRKYAFFRIHNAFLVNLARIQTITATDAVVDDRMLPISKHRKLEFLAALTDYIGKTI
ncbi:LytR/AlgR family response regulator transcription factor [Raoultibacter massiliensis]|uniref:LytR/AlgR family response regulator transcription factor n=1 Tax=Raoultibacter massiliensis TaxID=1852371 RepID=UPI003A93088F